MSKSHVEELMRVFSCLLRDFEYAYPTLRDEFVKDQARLESFVESRGIGVFLTDLPNAGKHLDRCLSTGEYTLSGLPTTRRCSNRVVIPRFLRGLYLLIFHNDGRIKENYDVQAILFLRQILLFGKKAKISCSEFATSEEVVKFYHSDCNLPSPDSIWLQSIVTDDDVRHTYQGFSSSGVYVARGRTASPSHEGIDVRGLLGYLDKVSGLVVSTLGPFVRDEYRHRHGPGAVAEVTGPTNKYCWRNWSDRLDSEFPIADCGYYNYNHWVDDWSSDAERIGSSEPVSRLVAVPKTFVRPRLIAAEPSEHQWCQQNIWHYFSKRVSQTWIGSFLKFRDQTQNQEFCTHASVEGHLATIDLSEASDSVTCQAVGNLFCSNPLLLRSLMATRTRYISQDITDDVPETWEIRKFSTMGNACTFPVESLLFLCIALAACLKARQLPATRTNVTTLIGEVSIFGDDIIVPVECRAHIECLLEILHFRVNTAKTFWNGLFKESCGVDSYNGVNVTPVYWNRAVDARSPESLASVVETANNFHRKFYLSTSNYLSSTITVGLPTVRVDSGSFGLSSYCGPSIPGSMRTRWNGELQRQEFLTPILSCLASKTQTNDLTGILQYFTEDPSPYESWEHGFNQRPRLKIRKRWVPVDSL